MIYIQYIYINIYIDSFWFTLVLCNAKSQSHGFEPYAQGLRYSSMPVPCMNPMDVPLGYKRCETTCNYQDEAMKFTLLKTMLGSCLELPKTLYVVLALDPLRFQVARSYWQYRLASAHHPTLVLLQVRDAVLPVDVASL